MILFNGSLLIITGIMTIYFTICINWCVIDPSCVRA
jgi:hypothetical protein